MLAGERSIYKEGKTKEDALDRTLPAILAPPRSPEGTAVILIIDKSSSMEGRKIELARQAASGVVENLRPIDTVGVLMFDNSFEWAVTPRRAEDRVHDQAADCRHPAGWRNADRARAHRSLQRACSPLPATYKHIVLMTDGISEEGDSLDLARNAENRKITISTVGLGQDVNRSYLERIASLAGGKSYFLNEPQGLEQILLHDVLEHTGSTAVEKADAAGGGQAGRDSGRGGHGESSARSKATCASFPSLPRKWSCASTARSPCWSAGSTAWAAPPIFASDATSRWAADWVSWQRLRQILDQPQPRPAAARAGRRSRSGIRQRQRRSGGQLPAGPRSGGARLQLRKFSSSARTASASRLK